jgi:hypothetical protein
VFVYCFKNGRLVKEIPKNARWVLIFLLGYSGIVILRSFSFSIQDWVTNFGNVYMALAWFTPIFIIVGQKIENWNILFRVIFFMIKLMIISLFFLPFYVGGKLNTEWTWLIRSVVFLLIIGIKRFKFSKRLLIIVGVFIYIIIAIQTQQRLEFIYLAIIAFLLLIDKLKEFKIKRSLYKLFIFGFLILVFLIFTYGYDNINLLINKVVEFKDTRTFLFTELSSELNTIEKLFGRGSLGKYHSDYFERTIAYYESIGAKDWLADDPDRITIEVGFLQMILKGGFLLFGLNLLLMVYSIYLALFKSRNKFIRRLGIFILAITVLSIISFRPAFTPTFILLWVSIGTVLNRSNRNLNDKEIYKLIKELN